jgi:serine/threonine protein kinase
MPPNCTLEISIVEGPDRGKRFVFRSPAKVAVGRSSQCEVPLNDPKISRKHCEIDVHDTGCAVRDLKSANGTRVNGIQIEGGALEDGDRVRVGDSALECAIAASLASSEDDTVETELPPQSLAGYKFLEKVGEGSYGVVYKAEQLALGRIVAVKVLPVARGKDPREVARFIRGAKVEALLSHRNIVQVYDFVRSRDVHVVMEYIQGEDLRRRTVRKGKLSVAEACNYAAQVLDGLQHAFERNVVHRDVKPENVIIAPGEKVGKNGGDENGIAKLTDFGLAKNFADTGLSGITSPDEGAGTPAYMPPEQLRCALKVDQRADIYSLGATLYHTLAGTPPFAGSVAEVIRRIQREPPKALSAYRDDVPGGLMKAIEKSLAKDAKDRYETPSAFRTAILPFAMRS